MSTAQYARLAVHPALWDRLVGWLESQDIEPKPAGRPGEWTATPSGEQLKAWRREAVSIPEADLIVERIGHLGQRAHESAAGVRVRHVPTQIVVESINHPKLLRNKVDALEILRDRLLAVQDAGVTAWWDDHGEDRHDMQAELASQHSSSAGGAQ
ncbi:hypothetical protein [Pseudonocardia sp. NPDC049154]|uniref:peptide chain release factor family protein n=1 Tax=Pseudonocardia sp. NPDC049154 TaxID=3155501 RepID=UPI0033DEC4A8